MAGINVPGALQSLGEAMDMLKETTFGFFYPCKTGDKTVMDVSVDRATFDRIDAPIECENISQITSFAAFRLYKLIGQKVRVFISVDATAEEKRRWENSLNIPIAFKAIPEQKAA
jgi:hypothetical protein